MKKKRAQIRRRMTYSKERLALDMCAYLRKLTDERAIEIITTMAAHLRTALWVYEKIEIPGIGILDIIKVGKTPVIRFTPDKVLKKDIEAAWRTLEL
jgi:nucleoid DNA-binding protein